MIIIHQLKKLLVLSLLFFAVNAQANRDSIFLAYVEQLLPQIISEDSYNQFLQSGPERRYISAPDSTSTDTAAQWLYGSVHLDAWPMSCDVYELNLKGSVANEYVVVTIAPLDGTMAVAAFSDDRSGNKYLGQLDYSAFRNQAPYVTFKQLVQPGVYDIQVYADEYRSVYYNEGLHLARIESDKLKATFTVNTVFEDHLNQENENPYAEHTVTFIPGTGESKDIQVVTRIGKRDEPLTLTGTDFYSWDKETRTYILQ